MVFLSKEEFEACLRGEASAQEKLYELAYSIAIRVSTDIAKTEGDAQDWAIQSVTHVFNKINQFKGFEDIENAYWGGRLHQWIKKVVHSQCVNIFTTSNQYKYRHVSDIHLAAEHSSFLSDSELKYEDLMRVIRKTLKGKKELQTFMLYLEGYGNEEISSKLLMSKGTVKWSISESRAKVRKSLNKLGYERRYYKGNTGESANLYRATRRSSKESKSKGVPAQSV